MDSQVAGPGPAPACARFPDAEAAGSVLRGALSLPSLEELNLYDIPWTGSLLYAMCAAHGAVSMPPTLAPRLAPVLDCSNLRRLAISRSFYEPDDVRSAQRGISILDSGAAEAWAALGDALAALPHLEHLDMSYTHAMTYCDPARGVAAAPWPALLSLRELSLAHDLAVQPPPPPPRQRHQQRATPSPMQLQAPAVAAEVANVRGPGTPDDDAVRRDEGNDQGPQVGGAIASDADVDVVVDTEAGLQVNMETDAGLMEYGMPMLTIEAAHAMVELLTWLPHCVSVTILDLRYCGLEAVPMAVAHLPALARLDLYGNPLVSMRLPGPLRSLVWLRLSLDPCYGMVYDAMVGGGGGDAAAVDEDMWSVELQAPLLEELEVESTSSRALGLIREAAPSLPLLRRLVLVDKSCDALN